MKLALSLILLSHFSDSFNLTAKGLSTDPTIFGNSFNFWKQLNDGWDLTRGNTAGAITLPMPKDGPIRIQPNKTALVILDMQNFFLHESIIPDPHGRAIVPATITAIRAFREAGMPVIWTNWGLTDFDLENMPPALLKGFTLGSTIKTSQTSFGSDMGHIVVPASDHSIAATDTTQSPNTTIGVGRKLFRGSWNAQPWGPLFDERASGIANGTDFFFNKNRLSGMWGSGTPMQTWLQDNGMTTLFFGGVNVDQCVWGTLLDSYYKGYDVVLVDDISATTSPAEVKQLVDFNAGVFGWRANLTDILPALREASSNRR